MKLEKKYGLITAISMVVGIVIGSGVFFKAQTVIQKTNGNMPLGILAWILGGLIMMACIYSFSIMANKYEKVNGIVDYAEVAVGKKYGYYVGWFMTFIYYPMMTSVLAWVSARYTIEIFNIPELTTTGAECMVIAGFYLICSYGLNALSPVLAGKFQVSTTIIKLVPLIITAIVGLIYGLVTKVPIYDATMTNVIGQTEYPALIQNFRTAGVSGIEVLFGAVVATAFAYEGWIIATSINAEMKDSKKNLPKALIIGSIIIIAMYIFYYVGVAGGADASTLGNDKGGAMYAFKQIFGNFLGVVLQVLIVVSCLGTLNGLMLGTSRGMYSIAIRGEGPKPEVFSIVDPKTNMPTNSSILAVVLCGFWLLYFFGANLVENKWFGVFSFDSSELPVVSIYAFYIPIFIHMMIKEKDLNVFKRFVMPIISIIACTFMIIAAIYAHGISPYKAAKADNEFSFPILFYLIVFGLIMFAAFLVDKLGKKKKIVEEYEEQ